MSWLYSLVVAGLLFSSSQNDPVSIAQISDSIAKTAARVVQSDETERFEQTYPLSANGRVSVSNVNGSIVINAWDKNEVRLVAVKTAETKERLADVEIKVDARPDSISIETEYGDWKTRNNGDHWKNGCCRLQVDYELTVPRGAMLNEIETVNGSVTVANFSNFTKISAVNGNVKASNLRGTANLSTVNGEVFADFDRLENGSRIVLSTVNGKVNLSIPSDSSATLRADSLNGVISNDFGLPVRKGQYVGRDLYGRIGAGEVQVKLSSVNGPLTIGRNKDGRNQSPATNLLQQKNKDDEDWDNDDDKDSDNDESVVNTEKMNKVIAKSVKQSQKDVAMAIKQSHQAITKIEIPKIEVPVVKIDTEALRVATEAINAADIQAQVDAGVRASADMKIRMKDFNISGMPRIEKKSDAIPVKGTPKVTIDAPGCSVKVRGWDRQEVQYTVLQFTNNRDRSAIQMSENHSDSAVNIRVVNKDPGAQQGDFSSDSNRVRVEVFVPRKSNLKITTNGEIRMEGVSGDIDLTGDHESIDVRDSNGKMSVATSCGQVRVIGFRGQLDAKTSEGNIYLEGEFEKLAARAADGTVILTLPENANASFVSNTDIESNGVDLVQEKDNLWRLGTGGPKYNFDFGDGHLVVRNASEIVSK